MNVKRLLLVALCSAIAMSAAESLSVKAVGQGASAGVSQYLVALPHIAYGGGWRTQIVIGNTSGAAADVTLYYFGDDGNPLSLAIGGVYSDHTTLTVPANGGKTVEPDWQGAATAAGWVGLVYSSAGIKIQGIFMWHKPDDPADKYTEATAPIVSQAGAACIIPMPFGGSPLTMRYDETEGRYSGYGFANTTNTAVTLNLTFYDQNGQTVGQYSERFAGFGHNQFLLRDKVPALANKKGTMQISGQGIVPLGFRFAPYNTFTTWLP
ncbi:MAG: hypothetical protein NTY38_32460 [Acidobacteria bacterium]|nr:hypothetical protein [Acidobacteriota bacterium]